MKTEFLEYMMEHLMLKTQENYKRALRHLEKEGIILDDPSSFKAWILEEKGKGTLDRTINVYIKAYNFYLKFLGYTPPEEGLHLEVNTYESFARRTFSC